MRDNLKRNIVNILPAVTLLLGFCYMSYMSAPQSEVFDFASINPLSFLSGLTFALSFGLGLAVWLSVVVVAMFVAGLYLALRWLLRRVF